MLKRITYFVTIVTLIVWALPFINKAEAATLKANFDSFTYTETAQADGAIKQTPIKVTFKNTSGQTLTYNVDKNVKLYVNNTVTTADAFKTGMLVEFQVSLRNVTAMYGKSGSTSSATPSSSKRIVSGYVTNIDSNGMFIVMKPDIGKEKTFYINKDTTYKKGNAIVDISSMYVGDRVSLTFNGTATTTISEVSITQTGVVIENLYKGTIQKVNAIANTLTVKNEQPFVNWSFSSSSAADLATVQFQNTTPIYYGGKRLSKGQLKQYAGNDVYYVTVKQFSKEIVKKIVVLVNNERTYFEDMVAVDTAYKFLNLKNIGRLYYHDGSILIRNGRLVEPTALRAAGTAFVVADGASRSQYAQVVQISSDSLTSPNLANHTLYFGELSLVDGYLLEIGDAVKLVKNNWRADTGGVFSFSNNTVAVSNEPSGKVQLSPADELLIYEGAYGYFYVKDDYVTAVHLLDATQPIGEEIYAGSLTLVDSIFPSYINIKNVNIWHNGSWLQTGDLINMNIDQATIIRSGKVIDASDLKASDRVVIISNSKINSHIILAD